jgi:hypothetical protein
MIGIVIDGILVVITASAQGHRLGAFDKCHRLPRPRRGGSNNSPPKRARNFSASTGSEKQKTCCHMSSLKIECPRGARESPIQNA